MFRVLGRPDYRGSMDTFGAGLNQTSVGTTNESMRGWRDGQCLGPNLWHLTGICSGGGESVGRTGNPRIFWRIAPMIYGFLTCADLPSMRGAVAAAHGPRGDRPQAG